MSENQSQCQKIAYFLDGRLYRIEPFDERYSLSDQRQVAYDSDTIIVSNGEVYDPEKPETIENLTVPNFAPHYYSEGGVTFDLSYILKMRVNEQTNKSVLKVFINKTLDMMDASTIEWRTRDYLRVICNFYVNGMFEEGDLFEKEYRESHPEMFDLNIPWTRADQIEHLKSKYYFEDKFWRYQEYNDLKRLLPELMPATVKGYLQIRTRNTKRFQTIKARAEELGYIIDTSPNKHFCRSLNQFVQTKSEYSERGDLKKVYCLNQDSERCLGRNEFGLVCSMEDMSFEEIKRYNDDLSKRRDDELLRKYGIKIDID